MGGPFEGVGRRIARWFVELSTAWKVGLGAAIVAAAVIASWQTYEVYDYVQHDNEFCLSCHLMEDPYRRYEESGHNGLGCKQCHQPTIVERSTMALTQIIEQPDTIRTHAEVPNERCASCHIEGSPEEWRLIANTAGHQVHLESDEPELEGLQCVECHSTSVHDFVPVSETCAQSGCHRDVSIRLGDMSQITELHCTVCHNFLRESRARAPIDTARAGLTPRSQDCRGCHDMQLVMGRTNLAAEPHGGVCGDCHNPHEQAVPAEAVESCTNSGCHASPDTITSFHRGLDPGTLEGCTDCHQAHTWEAPRSECLSCHQDIFRMEPSPVTTISGSGGGIPLHAVTGHGGAGAPAPQEGPVFSHRRHRSIDCTRCHGMEERHGELRVGTQDECMSCHHSDEAEVSCRACHEGSEIEGSRAVAARMAFSVRGEPESRSLPFDHERHRDLDCGACHTDAEGYDVGRECAACHEEHHAADGTTECRLCHEAVREGPHDRSVHEGCGGSGCHTDETAIPTEPTRQVCLTCHQDRVEHEPGKVCITCHPVPLGRSFGRDR